MAAPRRPGGPHRRIRSEDHAVDHGAHAREGAVTLVLLLRIAGASLVILALFHAVLWRTLDWGSEMARMSPLNAQVFAVHTFFIAFVLGALGLLSLARPDLLITPSDL